MRLINDQLKSELPAIRSNAEGTEETLFVRAKFFAVAGPATWLIFEYDPEDEIVFCYADLYGQGRSGGAELGYTSVRELESLRYGPIPLVERDQHFVPMPFLECIDSEGRIIA